MTLGLKCFMSYNVIINVGPPSIILNVKKEITGEG